MVDTSNIAETESHYCYSNLFSNVILPTEERLSCMVHSDVRQDDAIIYRFLTIAASQHNNILFDGFGFEIIEIDKGWSNLLIERGHWTHYAPFIGLLLRESIIVING